MDQIFDRLERLIKSAFAEGGDQPGRPGPGAGRRPSRSGDPDLDAAMDELDDFLGEARDSAEEAEARARERAAREEAERLRAGASGGAARPAGPDPRVKAAYETLGLPFGRPIDEVKARYKKLLMQHHPDRHAGRPENQKRATDMSARINEAYRVLETWTATGKLPD